MSKGVRLDYPQFLGQFDWSPLPSSLTGLASGRPCAVKKMYRGGLSCVAVGKATLTIVPGELRSPASAPLSVRVICRADRCSPAPRTSARRGAAHLLLAEWWRARDRGLGFGTRAGYRLDALPGFLQAEVYRIPFVPFSCTFTWVTLRWPEPQAAPGAVRRAIHDDQQVPPCASFHAPSVRKGHSTHEEYRLCRVQNIKRKYGT